jgi:hypothetical protein
MTYALWVGVCVDLPAFTWQHVGNQLLIPVRPCSPAHLSVQERLGVSGSIGTYPVDKSPAIIKYLRHRPADDGDSNNLAYA